MKRNLTLITVLALLVMIFSCRVFAQTGDKLIAITFDDGPSQYTEQLLDGLSARGAHVTFFTVGYCVAARPATVQRAWAEGHQIANHTWDHPYLSRQSSYTVASQLSRTDSALDAAVGFDLDYILRPPYGDFSQNVLLAANVPALFWSMNTSDYLTSSPSVVYQQIMQEARDGAVACLHDTHLSTVQGVLMAIDSLQSQGYECVTVSEMFYRRGIAMQNATMYYNAYPGTYGTADSVAAPVISVSDGENCCLVTITGDPRATVYYTTDGTAPTPANASIYSNPFPVSSSCTVSAVSVISWNSIRSASVTGDVTYIPSSAPTLSVSNHSLSMEVSTPGAEIHYSLDGTEPTENHPVYSLPIPLQSGTTCLARTFAPGYAPSPTSMLTCTNSGILMRDVSMADWFCDILDQAAFRGILQGTGQEFYAPNGTVSRAMFTTMLYRIAGSEPAADPAVFEDVSADAYYYPALCWASGNHFINGYDDGTFRPDTPISREALCTILARYLSSRGMDLSASDLSRFSDASDVDPWAKSGTACMVSLGVLNGYPDGRLLPLGTATRAEAAAMLLRLPQVPQPAADPVPSESSVPTNKTGLFPSDEESVPE